MNHSVEPKLPDLLNMGSRHAQAPEQSGNSSVDALRSMGRVAAAVALKAGGFSIGSSKLSALDGAIESIRWRRLPEDDRSALWDSSQALGS